jgi:hypothetical protein
VRWDADTDNPITHGEWVSAQEYDALAAELARSRAANAHDTEAQARIAALEAALRKIAEDVESRHQEGHYNFQYAIIARTALETPEQMHARVVTETADAIAKERGLTAETFDEHKA